MMTNNQGVSRGALYFADGTKQAWVGLQAVDVETVETEIETTYLDGQLAGVYAMPPEHELTITALTYPPAIERRDRKILAFTWTTELTEETRRVHILYNPLFRLQDRDQDSIGNTLELDPFFVDATSTPNQVHGLAPVSYLYAELGAVKVPWFVEEMEKLLFDTETSFLSLLEIDTLIAVFKEIQQHVQLLVIDHGNGLWTTVGPDSAVHYLDEATFEVNAPTLIYLDAFTYTVESI